MKPHPRNIILFHHFRRFLELANSQEIEIIPLKGAHLISTVYPEDVDRGVLCDVDFLVRPEFFDEIGRILSMQGFYQRSGKPYKEERHEAAYYLNISSQHRIMFEVHRALARYPIDHDGIWERSKSSKFDGVPCRYLSDEDAYVYSVLHELFHRFMWLSRTVQDLTMLLRYGSVDLDVVVARSKEWRLTRAVWTISRLVQRHDVTLGLNDMLKALQPTTVTQKVINYLVPDDSATRLFGLHHRLQAILLWTWLLDSKTQLAHRVLTHPYLQYAGDEILKHANRLSS